MTLKDDIADIREKLQAGEFTSESAILQNVVTRLLQTLGWNVYNLRILKREYRIQNGRVDIALCYPEDKPIIFLEVKYIGHANEFSQNQLFEYCSNHSGIQLAILTDGREWSFFLPDDDGNHNAEGCVYKLHIIERSDDECERILLRYLKYNAVKSGEAIQNAKEDHKNELRRRRIEVELPEIWKELIETRDESLSNLISEKIRVSCGDGADEDIIFNFLESLISEAKQDEQNINGTQDTNSQSIECSLTFHGETFPCKSGREVITTLFEKLIEQNEDFAERFMESRQQYGIRKRYLFERREFKRSHRLNSGHWLHKDFTRDQFKEIARIACQVANLRYDEHIIITFPPKKS